MLTELCISMNPNLTPEQAESLIERHRAFVDRCTDRVTEDARSLDPALRQRYLEYIAAIPVFPSETRGLASRAIRAAGPAVTMHCPICGRRVSSPIPIRERGYLTLVCSRPCGWSSLESWRDESSIQGGDRLVVGAEVIPWNWMRRHPWIVRWAKVKAWWRRRRNPAYPW